MTPADPHPPTTTEAKDAASLAKAKLIAEFVRSNEIAAHLVRLTAAARATRTP